VIEPDADGDGYGDESQDRCSTEPAVQGDCPPPPPKPIAGTSGGSTSGTSGGTSSGPQPIPGSGGSVLVGGIPLTPPNVSAAPPLPTPKTAKKAKRCSRKRVHGKRVKRCKRKGSHRRR
jgi:hypothetical protein